MANAATHYQPSGRGPQVLGIYAFFVALTSLTMILRVYARVYLVKIFGLDDWTAIVGWALFIAHAGFAIAGTYHGTGQHTNLIPPEDLPIGLRDWWMCEPLYVVGNMFTKLSIGLMLLRLVVEKSHRMLIYVVIGVLELYSVVYFFIFLFQCIPSEFFWTRAQGATNGKCMSTSVVISTTYVYSAITCVSDWIMALLPWFVIRKLQMNGRTKAMVSIILALGSVASAATIIRFPYVSNFSNVNDFLYATTDVAIWSCCETGLAISASSAATLKPLVKTFLERSAVFSSRSVPLASDNWPKRGYGRQSYIRTNSEGPSVDSRAVVSSDLENRSNITKTFEVTVNHLQR